LSTQVIRWIVGTYLEIISLEWCDMVRKTLAWTAIVLVTVVWASSLVLAKIIYAELTPIVFVTLRYTLACPFLVVLFLIYRRRSKTSGSVRADWKLLLGAGLAGPFISQVLQYIGLSMTSASETILLLNLSPVFAVLLALPFLGERITLEKGAGLLLAMAGAALIMLGSAPLEGGLDLWRLLGDLIVVVSTFFFAINGIVGKAAVRGVDSISLTLYSTLFAVPFLWLSAIILEDVTVLAHLSPSTWLVVLWVAVVNTVVAFILYYESMNYIEASQVQIALNLIAVLGVIMSVLVLNETTSWLQVLGGALTIVGVVIAQLRSKVSDAVPVHPEV
jgi:drug/metabolite transporter (DMT)-like permease